MQIHITCNINHKNKLHTLDGNVKGIHNLRSFMRYTTDNARQGFISFKGIAEEILRKEGPKISFNALKLAMFKESGVPQRVVLGKLPPDLAKNEEDLKRIVYGNLFLNNIIGLFKGRFISRLPTGGYSRNLKVTTKKNVYVVKIPLNYGLKGSAYKDIFFSNTSEFINGVRVGLGDEAMLAFHLTDQKFTHAARFDYYHEEIGCLVKEYIKGSIIKYPVTNTHLQNILSQKYGIRFLDEKNAANLVMQKDRTYKLIDFGRWVATSSTMQK